MITLSMIGKSYINGQAVFVEQESASFPVNIPSHKVEKGINITDHVELQPRSVSISGLLVRPTKSHVETILEYFRTCQNKGTLVTYQGRRIYTNMLISDLSIDADASITNGYKISMTLQEVRMAKPSYVPPTVARQIAPKSTNGKQQTVNKKTSPTYHLVKRGDTYSLMNRQYGSSIKQLRDWNKYPDRAIPIGVKLRVT